jgi:hypothetical protein
LIHFRRSISSNIDPRDRRLIHTGSVIYTKKAGQISTKAVDRFKQSSTGSVETFCFENVLRQNSAILDVHGLACRRGRRQQDR